LSQDSLKGVIELDLKRYEVRLSGRALKLEPHPRDLLILLLQRAGELVTREAIAMHVWGSDVHVDAEQGINTAVRKIRRALREDPDRPVFLETVVGKGYRFIGSCSRTDSAGATIAGEAAGAAGDDEAGVRGIDARGVAGGSDPGCCHLIWQLRVIPLVPGSTLVGRDPNSTVHIDSSSVSRRHAEIAVVESGLTIEDLRSKNGTFVNGAKIDALVRLADYDTIQIGPAILTCRVPSAGGSTLTVDPR
jgi:DNA-binding winged helix-turn-helix (wHTH) protein